MTSERMRDHPFPTWRTLQTDERRFALGVGIALTAITALPVLFGWWWTPPGYTFTGVSGLTAGDQHVYYSYIEQTRDGALEVRDLYTGEPTGGRMVQLPWFAIGLLARWTGWNAVVAFHVARLALIVPFVAFLSVVIAMFLRNPIAGISARALRRLALLLATLGMGAGALLGSPILPTVVDDRGWSNWPLDFWVPEAFPFLAMLRSPHFILSLWLTLAVYVASVRADATRGKRGTLTAMASAGVLTAFHPFYIPSILAVLTAHAIVRMVRERRWLPHLTTHVLAVGMAMLPAAVYWGLLALLDPIHAARAAQNLLWTGAWYAFALGYGLLLPAAAVGVAALRRARDHATAFLLVWTAVNLAILWVPIPWQRRFTQGFSVALAILSAAGLALALEWTRRRLPRRWHPIALWPPTLALALVVGFGFTTAVNLTREVTYYALRFPRQDPVHIFYYPTAGIDAMRWLRIHADPASVTLAPGITANFLPGWATRAVFAGHNVETAHSEEKILAFGRFLEADTAIVERWAFLRHGNIRYLFDPHFDHRHERIAAIARDLRLPIAYANGEVTIYRVPEER